MNMEWDVLMIPVFFFYGLAFYTMGFALWVESSRASELGFARSMRLLAGFGLLHGIHEWIDLLQQFHVVVNRTIFPVWIQWMQVVILVASFILLMWFGEHLRALDGDDGLRIWLIILAIGLYTVSCIVLQVVQQLDEANWIIVCDVLARYMIGIPASIVAAIVLFRQRHTMASIQMGQFNIGFLIAAISTSLYGVVGQLFVKPTFFLPANVINEMLFLEMFGFPIQLLRAALAVVIAVSMIHVLRVLEVESVQRLETIEQARRESEQRSNEALSRLNASLQASEAEARQLLAELRERDNLRTEFLQQVTSAQESERKRIARELHDGTGQMLTGLALGLRGLSTQVHNKPDLVVSRLSELETMATTTISELRHLIQDLRPPQLDDIGLVPAIRVMLQRFNETDETQYKLHVTGDPVTLSSEVETFLFRIIQEGITNVSKHAQATSASVTIQYLADGIDMCVCDDGIGCDPETIMASSPVQTSWGLHGIDERSRLINARWWIESEVQNGTSLKVHLPVKNGKVNAHDD